MTREDDGGLAPRALLLPAVQIGSFLVRRDARQATVATVMLSPLWRAVNLTLHLPWSRHADGCAPIELRDGADRRLLRSWRGAADPAQLEIVLGPLKGAMLLVPNVTLCGPRPCLS